MSHGNEPKNDWFVLNRVVRAKNANPMDPVIRKVPVITGLFPSELRSDRDVLLVRFVWPNPTRLGEKCPI